MHSQNPSHKGLQLTATHLGCSAQLSGRPSGAPLGAHPHPAPAWGPGGEKAPCQPRWAQDTPGPPMEGVLFLITILRPVNFLSICRCSSPYDKDGILVLSAPGKGPCRDLSYKREKKQGNACFSTGSFLPRLLTLSLTPTTAPRNSDAVEQRQGAQAQPALGSSVCPPACPLWERRPSSRSMGPPAWEAVCSATPSHLYLNPLHGLCLENSNVCFAGRVRTEAETCQRQRRPGVREPVSSSGWQGGQRWALGWNLQAWPCQFALGLGRGVSVLGQFGGVGEGAEGPQLGPRPQGGAGWLGQAPNPLSHWLSALGCTLVPDIWKL